MKFIYLIFILTISFINAGISIAPSERNSPVIFIYHSGKAIYHEIRYAELNDSETIEIVFTEMPKSIVKNQFKITSNNFDSYSAYISHKPINDFELLSFFEGNKIGLVKIDQNGSLTKPISATLISYDSGKQVYGIDGVVIINPKDMQPVFPYIPEELTEFPNIISSGKSNGGLTELLLSYFVSGLTWTASYNIYLSENNLLKLSGNYLLKNISEDSYENLQIYLVSATNNTSIQQASPIPKRESLHSTTHKVSNSFTFPELQYLEDFEIYNINELQNLPEGSTIQSSLLSTLEIPFQKEYVINHRARSNYRDRGRNQFEDDAWRPVSLELNILTNETLQHHLPPGVLNIYEDVDSYYTLIGEKNIGTISKGSNIRVDLQEAQDILYQIGYTNQTESKDGKFVTITGKFKNLKTKPIKIKWTESSSTPFTISESSIDFFQTDIFNAETILLIPAKETIIENVTLYYTKIK